MPLSTSLIPRPYPDRKLTTNIYSNGAVLNGHWSETRLEPHFQRTAQMSLNQLDPPTKGTWKTTSASHGDWKHDEMRRKLSRTASDHWLPMEKKSPDYKTTAMDDHCHPSLQRPPVAAPHIPDDGRGIKLRNGSLGFLPFNLKEYRDSWTKSDTDRFAKPKYGFL
mmetsp:Transcript_427/g.661  ORF Transcript_427/g.661 Transcript_427/m.661 type:complete len:165 (+) Transcript_427:62-556(+)